MAIGTTRFALACENASRRGGTPVADVEYMSQRRHSIVVRALTTLFGHEANTMPPDGDPFDVVEDLAAVRGGRYDGACCLEEILRQRADAAAAADPGPASPQPPRSWRHAWSPGLEADLAAAAEMRRSISVDDIELPTASAGVHSASDGSVDCPRVETP
jgi:hypothetical protein